jgi:hypothetical protein
MMPLTARSYNLGTAVSLLAVVTSLPTANIRILSLLRCIRSRNLRLDAFHESASYKINPYIPRSQSSSRTRKWHKKLLVTHTVVEITTYQLDIPNLENQNSSPSFDKNYHHS